MRTNSIISDPEPLTPTPTVQPAKNPEPQNDFEKLANSDDYPQIKGYLDQRIKFFQSFLPNGTPIDHLDEKQEKIAWGNAVTIIKELEMIENTLKNYKRKK